MAQITILNQNNVPQGPFSRSEVAQRLQSGEFTLSSLAFVEGLSQWTPLREVLAKIDASLPPTPLAPPPVILPPAAQRYSYAATMQPPSHLVYAGFWLRFVAYIIDSLIINAVLFGGAIFIGIIIGFIAGLTGRTIHSDDWNSSSINGAAGVGIALLEFVIWAAFIVAIWLYFALMESGPGQATLGKKALGLKVTNLEGQRIGFGAASGRFFGKIISGMILMIGYIMAAFTERKQALHDMLAGTLVVRG